MKKNVSIEVLRIIACILVIMAHIQLHPVQDGIVINGRLIFSAIIADNVPIFFLITGFYMFKDIKTDHDILTVYRRKIKDVIIKLWIPAFIVAIISCYLEKRFYGKEEIDWLQLWNFVFKLQAGGNFGHLWYICTYIKIIIWFPLFALLCQNQEIKNKIRRLFIIASLSCVFLNDLEYVIGKDFTNFSDIFFNYHVIYIFLGYELSLFLKDDKNENSKLYVGGVVFILSIITKVCMQKIMYSINGVWIDNRFLWLESFLCYFSSCSIFCFWYSLRKNLKENKIIFWLGKYTFYIYLFHILIINMTPSIKEKINSWHLGENFISTIFYYVEYGALIFLLSLIISIPFEKIYHLLITKIGKILFLIKSKKQYNK